MTKYHCHFLVLSISAIVPMMSQCSYTALLSRLAEKGRGVRVTSGLSEKRWAVCTVTYFAREQNHSCNLSAF
jgi:hypothetical protein